MDIGSSSMIMSQSRVQENVGIALMKMGLNTGKENDSQVIEMLKNVSGDPNIGSNLDVTA